MSLYGIIERLVNKGPENTKLSTDDSEAFKEYEDIDWEARGMALYY